MKYLDVMAVINAAQRSPLSLSIWTSLIAYTVPNGPANKYYSNKAT